MGDAKSSVGFRQGVRDTFRPVRRGPPLDVRASPMRSTTSRTAPDAISRVGSGRVRLSFGRGEERTAGACRLAGVPAKGERHRYLGPIVRCRSASDTRHQGVRYIEQLTPNRDERRTELWVISPPWPRRGRAEQHPSWGGDDDLAKATAAASQPWREDHGSVRHDKTFDDRPPDTPITDDQLQQAAGSSTRIRENDFPEIDWEHSHVVRVDGGLKSFCIYTAPDTKAIRDHAAAVGIPADQIHEIHTDIIPGELP
jgi:hypothetical protein